MKDLENKMCIGDWYFLIVLATTRLLVHIYGQHNSCLPKDYLL